MSASDPKKIVQLVRTGHADLIALTEAGEMFERTKDSRDMSPRPRHLWKKIPGPFDPLPEPE